MGQVKTLALMTGSAFVAWRPIGHVAIYSNIATLRELRGAEQHKTCFGPLKRVASTRVA